VNPAHPMLPSEAATRRAEHGSAVRMAPRLQSGHFIIQNV
jgi:hypothetical protein